MLFDVVILYYTEEMNGNAYRVNRTTHKLLSFVLLELVVLQPHAIPERNVDIDFLEVRHSSTPSVLESVSLLFSQSEILLNFDRDGAFG